MRLDQFLLQNKKAKSRTQASDLIKAGKVKVLKNGVWELVRKTSFFCDEETQVEVAIEDEFLWVSRSGEKLNLALDKIGIDVTGFKVLDVGQSTGGFSECVLKRGAGKVVGVDVGTGQLAEKLRLDPRVKSYEGVDARNLKDLESFKGSDSFDLLVMDVSFISSVKVLKSVYSYLKPGGFGLILIKPQFEVGKTHINKGGIVISSQALLSCQKTIFSSINLMKNLVVKDYFPSSLRGKDGNQEFFCFFKVL